ncbi:hypothetical protein GAY33_16325, partial [Azospirillum brasilense]|nr:hypothetical protein [Azospirillum argentinense]
LGSAELVKELLGAQPNLALGLCALADLILGRDPQPKSEPVSPPSPPAPRSCPSPSCCRPDRSRSPACPGRPP